MRCWGRRMSRLAPVPLRCGAVPAAGQRARDHRQGADGPTRADRDAARAVHGVESEPTGRARVTGTAATTSPTAESAPDTVFAHAPLSQNTKVEALEAGAALEGLAKKDLVELARLTEDMEVPAGRSSKEGDSGREFFVIVDGEARGDAQGQRIAKHEAGDFFGEIALVEHVPRTATVTRDDSAAVLRAHQRVVPGPPRPAARRRAEGPPGARAAGPGRRHRPRRSSPARPGRHP